MTQIKQKLTEKKEREVAVDIRMPVAVVGHRKCVCMFQTDAVFHNRTSTLRQPKKTMRKQKKAGLNVFVCA
jgi:hypothetical protein